MFSRTQRFLLGAAVISSFLLACSTGLADVFSLGSVNPDPLPGDDLNTALVIGLAGDDNPELRGYVRVDGGDAIRFASLIIGDDEGYHGELSIAGTLVPDGGSQVFLDTAGVTPTVQVGRAGVGVLTIGTASSLFLENLNADLVIGVESSGIGTVTVQGDFSQMVIPNEHIVGADGYGRMEVLDGGYVQTVDTTNTTIIGDASGSVGEVLIDGPGSIWKIDDNLTVGGLGLGTLKLNNQGLLDIDRPGNVTLIGAAGRLELDGGMLAGDTITNNGFLGGSGLVSGTVSNSSLASLIDVPDDAPLRFNGDVSNQGSIRIRRGEAEVLDTLQNLPFGRITLEAGRLRVADAFTNQGVLAVVEGSNHIHGVIDNNAGDIVLASDTVGTFYDTVTVGTGSIELLTGANALFLADLIFEVGSFAAMQLSSENQSASQIHVAGEAMVAGTLNLELPAESTPAVGDSYNLLSADGGINGMFLPTSLPALDPGLIWNLDYQTNHLILEVLATTPADFNGDGSVDQADRVAWGEAFGLNDGADADGDNDTDGADFLHWQQEFGFSALQASSGASATVPEPTTLMLLLAGLLPLSRLPRRR